jgi:hypothetical protein
MEKKAREMGEREKEREREHIQHIDTTTNKTKHKCIPISDKQYIHNIKTKSSNAFSFCRLCICGRRRRRRDRGRRLFSPAPAFGAFCTSNFRELETFPTQYFHFLILPEETFRLQI